MTWQEEVAEILAEMDRPPREPPGAVEFTIGTMIIMFSIVIAAVVCLFWLYS